MGILSQAGGLVQPLNSRSQLSACSKGTILRRNCVLPWLSIDYQIKSMDATGLKDEIVTHCVANANDAIVKKYAIYFKDGKEGYDAYGLSTELLLSKVKELNNNSGVTLPLILEAAPLLLKSGKHEETAFVLLLAEGKLKLFKAEDFDEISQWYTYGIINWAQCDLLCHKIIPWFFLNKLIPLSALKAWQTSSYRFQRRSVAVPLIKLLKSTDDYTPFFDLITPVMICLLYTSPSPRDGLLSR